MNFGRLIAALLLVPLLLVALAGDARAQGARSKPDATPKTEAQKVKATADMLMDQDRYADALVLYKKAYELSADPALLYNQGRAYEALGDYPTALEKLEQFETTAPQSIRARVPGLRDLIVDLRGRISTLVIKTNAPGARVLVREKDEGTVTNERKLLTRSGTASVEVSADGFETFRREVELAPGGTIVVDANLIAKKRDALVLVRTKPPANIAFDGKALGRGPLQLRATAGPHELVATADGYYEERVPMTLALGDKREVDLDMRKTPGILSKWWFWTGVGVIVLGGVATAIVLTTEREPSKGSFTPGNVAVP